MKINGLVACWNFSDYLALTIERWLEGLDSLTIVTHPEDVATQALIRQYQTLSLETDLWSADGAYFNRGRCFELARVTVVPPGDWLLLFDADCMPERNWKRKMERAKPRAGFFYGAPRHQCGDHSRIDFDWPLASGEQIGFGYFQLFHTEDVRAQDTPLIETCWKHAGIHDARLRDRWPEAVRKTLPLRINHLGERAAHWCGRGSRDLTKRVIAQYQKSGNHDQDRIKQSC